MSERKKKRLAKKQARKQLPLKKKILRYSVMVVICIAVTIFSLATLGTVVQATGLVDDTINASNRYSQYPLDNYQLDFYVDNSWGWLPWNWGEGIGKQVMYGLYAITNFIWTISLYLSNATGYVIQEAYKLDFISQTADAIGKNIQTIAGVTRNGFSTSGFYVGFLLILILFLGIYVVYTGLIKRETTKAVKAVINFVVVFILSASFIAYAPDYIKKINDFSTDISTASLDVGTKIIMPDSESKGKDSVDLIRDALFSVQVEQPWLLLQYGNSDKASLGEERVEELLSTSPDLNDGDDREDIVKNEIENENNNNLTITKTINRLGTVFFLFFFNIGISIFVFLLTGIMIFSQVLFIIYAMFLPVSFLMSMVPSFEATSKRAITKLFNTIMARAGLTLIITVAFSLSTMFYSLSAGSPFFLIAFLQIVTFAGIYFKLGDLMNMFSLQSNDSQGIGRQIMRRPSMFMHRHTRRLQHKLGRSLAYASKDKAHSSEDTKKSKNTTANHERPNGEQEQTASSTNTEEKGAVKHNRQNASKTATEQNQPTQTTQTKDSENQKKETDKKEKAPEPKTDSKKQVRPSTTTQKGEPTKSNSSKTEPKTKREKRRQNNVQRRQAREERKAERERIEPMYSMKQAEKKRRQQMEISTVTTPPMNRANTTVPRPATDKKTTRPVATNQTVTSKQQQVVSTDKVKNATLKRSALTSSKSVKGHKK